MRTDTLTRQRSNSSNAAQPGGGDAVQGIQPSAECIRQEVELIVNSTGFRRSERLARFLRFTCDTVLAGDSDKLNEYLIAHRVFDRGEDYSPGGDSVVRRQAFSLRQKLQDYYLHEGSARPIRIELPTGGYVPVFTATTEAAPPAPKVTQEKIAWNHHPWFIVMALVLALAAGWTVGHKMDNAPKLDPAFKEIWGEWLSDRQQTVLCFSTPMTASIRQVPKPLAANSLVERIAIKPDEVEAEQFRRQLNLKPGGYFYLFPGLGHAKMGEALGSIRLCALLTQAGVPVRAEESRFLSWDDFRNENVIVLGHDEANAWVDPILSKLPLRLASTSVDKPRRIVNLQPKEGERAEYYTSYPPETSEPSEDYVLISMLAGVDGRHRLALVSGVNTEGTQMGLEYLADPASLRKLAATLRQLAAPKDNPHFQVVLHAELRDRVPIRVEQVLARIVP